MATKGREAHSSRVLSVYTRLEQLREADSKIYRVGDYLYRKNAEPPEIIR